MTGKTISYGKFRALQMCSTEEGAISVIAVDHRGNLRAALADQSDEGLSAFKAAVIKALAPAASAALIDPEYGIGAAIKAGALPARTGLLATLEAQGYSDDPAERQPAVISGWSVAAAKRIGAHGIKLLVYYHPEAADAAAKEQFIAGVIAACEQEQIPLYLEPLSYSLERGKKLSPAERRRVVIESARRLTGLGVDILKAEFPLDAAAEPDRGVWAEACAELTEASACPWVLLSAGGAFEQYAAQVEIACRAGASGVAVGRAVWQEAAALTDPAREAFLWGEARTRMQMITDVCRTYARPWTAAYRLPDEGVIAAS